MRTLNEYIKESILDDEEKLIRNSIKDSQNPFYLLSQHIKNGEDTRLDKDFKAQIEIKNILHKFIFPELPEHLKNLKLRYLGDNISLVIDLSDYETTDFIMIRTNIYSDVGGVNTNEDDELMIFFLDPTQSPSDKRDLNKIYKLTKDKYDRFIKKFTKKFNLHPSKDKYIYSI
jgi:hypothetical protein